VGELFGQARHGVGQIQDAAAQPLEVRAEAARHAGRDRVRAGLHRVGGTPVALVEVAAHVGVADEIEKQADLVGRRGERFADRGRCGGTGRGRRGCGVLDHRGGDHDEGGQTDRDLRGRTHGR